MNERILELAKQAGFEPHYEPDGTFSYSQQFEKFAELIAKECAILAMTEHHSTSPADYDEMDPYEQGCDDTASAISGKIRRIFGV